MGHFEDKLPAAAQGWVKDGLISEEQRVRIVARHPVQEGHGQFIAILSMIGGVLLAAGLILLIASHWKDIGDWVKIGGLVTLLIGTNLAGWHFRVSPGAHPRWGDVCLMLASVLFLGGIVLISQIFHLNARPATGVMIWWLGILLIPLLTRSKAVQLVSLIAELTWMGMEFGTSGSWLELTPGSGAGEDVLAWMAIFAWVGLAIVCNGYGLRGGRWEGFSGLHHVLGLSMACVTLYVIGFAWSGETWSHVPRETIAWPALAVAGGLLVLNALFAWVEHPAGLREIADGVLVAALASAGWLFWPPWSGAEWWLGMAACVALFLLNLVMIRAGLRTGRAGWLNLGITFIALNVLTRYFVLFGTMLQGGLFFVVTGVVVIAVGLALERQRRRLLSGLVRKEAR